MLRSTLRVRALTVALSVRVEPGSNGHLYLCYRNQNQQVRRRKKSAVRFLGHGSGPSTQVGPWSDAHVRSSSLPDAHHLQWRFAAHALPVATVRVRTGAGARPRDSWTS